MLTLVFLTASEIRDDKNKTTSCIHSTHHSHCKVEYGETRDIRLFENIYYYQAFSHQEQLQLQVDQHPISKPIEK